MPWISFGKWLRANQSNTPLEYSNKKRYILIVKLYSKNLYIYILYMILLFTDISKIYIYISYINLDYYHLWSCRLQKVMTPQVGGSNTGGCEGRHDFHLKTQAIHLKSWVETKKDINLDMGIRQVCYEVRKNEILLKIHPFMKLYSWIYTFWTMKCQCFSFILFSAANILDGRVESDGSGFPLETLDHYITMWELKS